MKKSIPVLIAPLVTLILVAPAPGSVGDCASSEAHNPGPVNIIVTQRGEIGVGCQTP